MNAVNNRLDGHLAKIVVYAAFLLTLVFAFNLQSHSPENTDFVGYWAAAKLFVNGQNPYDSTLLMNLEKNVGALFTAPMMVWNPPIIFAMLWPLGTLEFETANNLWTLINVFLIFISLACTRTLFVQNNPAIFVSWLMVLCFQPLHQVFRLGQLSLMLVAAFLVAVTCITKNKRFLGGVLFSILLIKPHLVFLVFLSLLFDAYRTKDLKILSGVLFGLIALFAVVFIQSPQIISQWLNISGGVVDWKSATWVTQFRLQFAVPGKMISWPLYVVPLVGTSVFLLLEKYTWKFAVKFKPTTSLIERLQIALLLSIIFSPYGWFFDFVLLLPIQVYCATQAISFEDRTVRLSLLLSLILINLLTEVVGLYFSFHHQFFWYPTVLGLLYFVTRHFLQKFSTNH